MALAEEESETSPEVREEVLEDEGEVCWGLPFSLAGIGSELVLTGLISLRSALATTALLRRDIDGGWEVTAPRVLVLLLANVGIRWKPSVSKRDFASAGMAM